MTTQNDVCSRSLLQALVNILLRNYPDAQWDAETRRCLAQAHAHVSGQPIIWDQNDCKTVEESS